MRKRISKWRKAASALLAAAMVLSFVPVGKVNARTDLTGRELLGMTLQYCAEMDVSKYTEDSYAAFEETLLQAQTAYDENSLSDEEFAALRSTLEEEKAGLVFVSDPEDVGNPLPFRQLSVDEIVSEMGTGWNLGNTMDGHTGFTPNETLWQDVETTKELIRSVHDLGFNTVRIPVTWGTMINDEDYSIDETWMSRVQDIVDYCVAQDMYVIINVHHDGAEQLGWLRVAADDIDSVCDKFEGVWRTIATRFRDYDEHLIFESMNEVTGDGTTSVVYDTKVIMNLNQIFVNVVRSTGSNNAYRFLSVPGRYTNIDHSTDPTKGFAIPNDTVENRIFVAVHYYDWGFGMAENMSSTTWSYSSMLSLQDDFEKLLETFTSQGIPVIMGEYGCINKNNPTERAYHVEVVNRLSSQTGVVPVYWDQGWYDRSIEPADYSFTLIDRNTGETIDKEVTDAIMRGMFVDGLEDLSDIVSGTTVTEISGTDLPDSVSLQINQLQTLTAALEPAATNDVLLWSTDDPTIATVYNGNIRGRGIGVTTIHAYSQSGSYEKTITVTVSALENDADDLSIVTDYDNGVTLEEGKKAYLNAVLYGTVTIACGSDSGEGTEDNGGSGTYYDFLTYKSSDESVATVSTTGKIVAKGVGTTYITITAASGLTKVIPVTVEKSADVKEISLSLNVYFNDSTTDYYSNEYGEIIQVTGDGQYELTFDCAVDLSDSAREAGVTGLNNLTAIYIKDQSVTDGTAKVSPLESCNIMYDSIIVDGVELTITQTEPKSALKASGILDTNDPFNSWDGSQVAEVDVNNHVLNITGVDNPQKVTVVFTLSDMVFTEGTSEEGAGGSANVEQINVPQSVSVTSDSATQAVELSVDGEDGAKLTVVPADASAVAIDTTAVTVEDGKASIQIIPLQTGATTVTVYADNGVTASFDVSAEITEVQEEAELSGEQEVEIDDVKPGETEEQEAGTADKSKTNWALIIIVGIIAAAAAGFGGYFVTNKIDGKKDDSKDGKKDDKKEETTNDVKDDAKDNTTNEEKK